MNLGKQELDALLGRWPAPLPRRGGDVGGRDEQGEEGRWDERADTIVKVALSSKGEGEALDVLLAAPNLPPEPGESGVAFLSGEKKMMDREKEQGDAADEGASTKPPAPSVAPPADRKRTSLKEMAARASQSGGRPSSPGARPSSPGAAPASVAPPARPSQFPATDSKLRPATAAPLPRPAEAGKDDSGVINLDVVRASATAQQVAAAEKAKPAQAGLFEDDHTVESAVNPAEKPTATKAPQVAVVAAKKNRAGPMAGIAIAVLGLAAAFAIVHKRTPPGAPQPAPVAESRPKPEGAAAPVGPSTAAPQAAPGPSAVAAADPTSAPASPEPEGKQADPLKGGPLGGPAPGTTAAPSKDAVADAKGAAPSGKGGDLQSEMARAVGGSDQPKPGDPSPTPEPASGGTKNQNIPEQPSQGSVQAAVSAVIGGAKACVAGADDISRATVTFSSSGAVSSVSVSGWAAAHGKSACVQAALKGAKVGAFSKSTFTVPVPIRP
jgi:hypothetical protein